MPLPVLLERLLVCPQCRGELVFPRERQEVLCPHCRLAYPVVEDIPVMLVSAARPLQDRGDASAP